MWQLSFISHKRIFAFTMLVKNFSLFLFHISIVCVKINIVADMTIANIFGRQYFSVCATDI